MESIIKTLKIKNHTLKLIKNEITSKILLDEIIIWTDHINNHINSDNIKESFDEYAIHCLSELSNIRGIEQFGNYIGSTDLEQIISSMGYSLTFKFCSEGDLNKGRFMDK